MRFGGALVLLFPLLSPARAETQTSEASSSDVLTPRVGHELFGTFQNAHDKQVVLDARSTVILSWSQIKQTAGST